MRTRRVLIVGGGSAGWMAAAYLEAALRNNGRARVEIGVIESPDVPRIGVGEATIPSIRHILAVVGIEPLEFLRRVDGTFKQAIKFVGWLDGAGEHFYHPFDRYREAPVDRAGMRWLGSDRSVPFAETTSVQPAVCELGLGPVPAHDSGFGEPLRYAFHMDALRFADLLTEIATGRGVSHYLDHVTGVEQAGNGDIRAVLTKSGARHEADLFIDCTGFAGLLIGERLGVDWIDCSEWLLCDRAVTMNVPYDRYYAGSVRPYTTATALANGWVWEIPLQTRKALGYVHASAFVDAGDAERELRAFEGEHADALDTRVVGFRVGHRARVWARNCIATGLAANFIEPLESTGLYLSDLAAVMLAEHFPFDDGDMAPLAARYNRILANRFYEILDFINLHYCLSRRDDTAFWREVRRPERVNDRLRAKLDFWRHKVPSRADFVDQCLPGQALEALSSGGLPGDDRPAVDTAGVFGIESYEAILYGMDFAGVENLPQVAAPPPARVLPAVTERLGRARQALPPHEAWLQGVAGMPVFPVAGERRT